MNTQIDDLIQELHDLKRQLSLAKSDKLRQVIIQSNIEIKRNLRWSSYNLLYELGRIQSALGDSKIEMIDYSTTFDVHESVNHVTYEMRGRKNSYKDIIMFYIRSTDSSYNEDLSIIRARVHEGFNFNLNDVVINDFKKPSYIIETEIAEKKLKKWGLIRNNRITDLALLVLKIYRSSEEPGGFDGLMRVLRSIVDEDYDGNHKNEVAQFHSNNENAIKKLKTSLETEFE